MFVSMVVSCFRKVRKRRIEFDPHVTTIVGPSQSGKSCTLNALRWVLQNTPDGIRHITWGEKEAKVTLKFDDGQSASRVRSGEVNLYKLNGTEFKGLGRGLVPDELQWAFNVSDLNFQGQMDSPLWFGDTAGQVSKELNRLVDLELIDESLAAAAAQTKEAKSLASRLEANVQLCLENIEELAWVKEAAKKLEHLGAKNEEVEKLSDKIRRLSYLYKQIRINKGRAEEDRKKYDRCLEVRVKMETSLALQKKVLGLRSVLTEIREIKNASEKVIDASKLKELWDKAAVLNTKKMRLEWLLKEIREKEKQQCRRKSELEEAQRNVKEAMKGKCPLCGNPLKKE